MVTYQRKPLFSTPESIAQLRRALAAVRLERPLDIAAAVVLPDHMHFVWTLPEGDTDYPWRIGRFKVLFTRSLRGESVMPPARISTSRYKHRASDVWQRRYWEHTIVDEAELEQHLNDIHDNPVKHGFVTCPHLWPYRRIAESPPLRGGMNVCRFGLRNNISDAIILTYVNLIAGKKPVSSWSTTILSFVQSVGGRSW